MELFLMVDFSQARRAMVDGQLRTADVTRTDILDIFFGYSSGIIR